MITRLEQDLFYLLRCAVTSGSPDSTRFQSYSQQDLEALYELSTKHSVQSIPAYYLGMKNLLKDTTLQEKARTVFLLGLRNVTCMEYDLQSICGVLEAAGIDYLPLKGAVLRDLYPESWMRSSCDIDILVREDDLQRAKNALVTELSCRRGTRNYHDVSISLPSGVYLELHFSIKENISSMDCLLEKVWQYAHPVDTLHRYEMEPEFFFFHQAAHAAYHFLSGGCGVRTLLDWYLLKGKLPCDREKLEWLLREGKLSTFARRLDELTDCCFDGTPFTELSKLTCRYILSGGTYGIMEQSAMIAKTQNGGSLPFLRGKLFPSRERMAQQYPPLTRRPGLLPIFWLIRWGKLLDKGTRERYLYEMKTVCQLSESDYENTKRLLKELGLEEKNENEY